MPDQAPDADTAMVQFRVTPALKNHALAVAKSHKQSLAAWMRSVLEKAVADDVEQSLKRRDELARFMDLPTD